MELNKLYEIADRDGIIVDHLELPVNKSISININGCLSIAMDRKIPTEAERRVCLAHELGHCETMSFYNVYSPLDVRGKHELRANRWAITQLVPRTKYFKIIKQGYCDIYSLAEYFEVTEDFMKKAVEYYSENYL